MSFKLGTEQKKEILYNNAELNYANRGYVLDFFHVPSGKSVQFKAMLTTFEDKFQSDWKQEMVYGRNDPIQTFQGTKRSISLAWTIPASSIGEAKDNLQKISLLNAMLYPSYKSTDGNVSTISSSPLFKLSFSNLIRNYGTTSKELQNSNSPNNGSASGLAKIGGLVGSINGFSFNPNLEIGFFDNIEDSGQLFPKEMSLSCEFTVIHTHPVGWVGNKFNPQAGKFPYGLSTEEIDGSPPKDIYEEEKRITNIDKINTLQQRKITGK